MASRLDGTLLLAASDGAGSARHAARGASLAVSAAVAALAAGAPLQGDQWQPGLQQALLHARNTLAATARRAGQPLRDYACTLLLAVISENEVAGLQLGDGAIVISGPDGTQRLTRAGRGLFAGETVFVTSPHAARQASTALLPAREASAVALLTDGLEPVATELTSGEPFAPFFTPLFRFAARSGTGAALQDFLASERIATRTHDDTTLLLAVRQAARDLHDLTGTGVPADSEDAA
jgi:hypothetical protein